MRDASSFSHFPARFYLDKYYAHVGVENEAFMQAVAKSVQTVDKLGTVIELGGGPSLCGMFAMAAATRAGPERVIWVDVAPSSLAEVESWLEGASHAFEYTKVLRWIGQQLRVDPATIIQRLRSANWETRMIDLWEDLPADLRGLGDIIGSYFVAEAAASDELGFIELTSRISEVASSEARIALAYIRRSQPYRLDDDVIYPAFAVDEANLPHLLERAGLSFADVNIDRGPLEEPPARPGYEGMVFVVGQLAVD
jgi:hypothetical protein